MPPSVGVTKILPGGSCSVTTALPAGLLPILPTVTVAIMGTLGCMVVALNLTEVSKSGGLWSTCVITGPPVLSVVLGSWTPAGGVIVTVFWKVPDAGAVARTSIVTKPPAGNVATLVAILPLPLPAAQIAPALPTQVQVTPVKTAGSASTISAPLADAGPLLMATMRYVITPLGAMVVGPIFDTAISATSGGNAVMEVADALALFAGVGSMMPGGVDTLVLLTNVIAVAGAVPAMT